MPISFMKQKTSYQIHGLTTVDTFILETIKSFLMKLEKQDCRLKWALKWTTHQAKKNLWKVLLIPILLITSSAPFTGSVIGALTSPIIRMNMSGEILKRRTDNIMIKSLH